MLPERANQSWLGLHIAGMQTRTSPILHRWIPRQAALVLGVSLLASLGCDPDEQPVDSSEALEEPDSNEITGPTADEVAPAPLRVTVAGEERPDRIIASVEPDPDTKIYFLDSGSEGEPTLDVVITGRDGGIDYGGMLGPDKATPLELYLAFAEDDQPIPEGLIRVHNWQVEHYRGQAPELDIQKPGEIPTSVIEDTKWWNEESTYSCLSWSNFQSYMATRFSGDPDRVEDLSYDVGTDGHTAGGVPAGYYYDSDADMVVCNFETDDAPYNDKVNASACAIWGEDPEDEDCAFNVVDDGHYFRRLYSARYLNRRYTAGANPQGDVPLTSFAGAVVRDPF